MSSTYISSEIARFLANVGLPVGQGSPLIFLILLIFEIALLIALAKLLKSIIQTILKELFHKRFRIVLSNAVTVAPLFQEREQGEVTICIPFWKHANKDGSRDRRRQENQLMKKKSSLIISRFSVKGVEPYAIYWLYRELALRGSSFTQPLLDYRNRRIIPSNEPARTFAKPASDVAAEIYKAYINAPTDFEEYCADLFRLQGYKAKTTPKSNDGGFDIEMIDPQGARCIVECKCYNPMGESVGRELLQKLVGANAVARASRMLFITTAHFTDGAITYARSISNPIELIDGAALEKLARKAALGSHSSLNPASGNVSAVNPFNQIVSWETIAQYYPPDAQPANRAR